MFGRGVGHVKSRDLERLPVGHLHRDVVAAEPSAIPFGPHPGNLDADRRLHLARLHRRGDGGVPRLRRLAGRFGDPHDGGGRRAITAPGRGANSMPTATPTAKARIAARTTANIPTS